MEPGRTEISIYNTTLPNPMPCSLLLKPHTQLLSSPELPCPPLLSLLFPPTQHFTCPRQYLTTKKIQGTLRKKRPQQRPLGAQSQEKQCKEWEKIPDIMSEKPQTVSRGSQLGELKRRTNWSDAGHTKQDQEHIRGNIENREGKKTLRTSTWTEVARML